MNQPNSQICRLCKSSFVPDTKLQRETSCCKECITEDNQTKKAERQEKKNGNNNCKESS